MFIRKRDPRYVKETIDEAKLQASLLAASQSQAARAKATFQENLKDFQTQNWMEVEQNVEEDQESEESEVEEEFECVACRKVYKNERYIYLHIHLVLTYRQFEAHLRGKKHIKAAQALRKEMREQDEELGVSDGISTHGAATPIPKQSSEIEAAIPEEDDSTLSSPTRPTSENGNRQLTEDTHGVKPSDSENQDNAHDVDVDENTEARKDDEESDVELKRELDRLFLGGGTKKERPPPSNDTKPKVGAAKAKRQKKAEKQAALEAEGKLPPKPHKNRKPYDASAAIQKARGETVATGKRNAKKK